MEIKIRENNIGEVLDELNANIEVALDAVGVTATSDVQVLVPVDTGRLRDSITHRVDGNSVSIGTNVEYGKYVELGDNKTHKNGQAHFLRDGIENNIDKYRQMIINEFSQGD